MNQNELLKWKQSHQFNIGKKKAELRTMIVILITITVMVIEIIAGWYFNSMALFADGWHMMTHAIALSISLVAYVLARKLSKDSLFAFGTWKIEVLGAYTSAIVLGMVGGFILVASVVRILNPVEISYNQALVVAVIGLVVNIACAIILKGKKTHGHDHHKEKHQDMNLRSAYLHVLADALTSALAIIALLGAKFYSWNFLDPIMGMVGGLLIFRWTYMLIRETSMILLDHEKNALLIERITKILESNDDTWVSDIHVWRVAQQKYACIVSLVACEPLKVEYYKSELDEFQEIGHLTVEVNCYK